MTDFLTFASDIADIYKTGVPILVKGVEAGSGREITDIASGGGGGWGKITGYLIKEKPDLQITLTDFFPNISALAKIKSKFPANIFVEELPVNALEVPAAFSGLRTMFLSFHHFKPAEAKQILQNAVDAKVPIAIFEAQQRKLLFLIPMMISPVNTLLVTPFIRPFRWSRLLFTYILPILPLCIMWDGIVSVFRTYTQEEMLKMTKELRNADGYIWEIGVTGNGMAKIQYMIGLNSNSNRG